MTYARYLERLKHDINGPTIEKLIPFWEFIDIEWEEAASTFHFTGWYTQNEITHTKPGQPSKNFLSNSTTTESGEEKPAGRTMARQRLAKPTCTNASILQQRHGTHMEGGKVPLVRPR